jgi:hypothetical protein
VGAIVRTEFVLNCSVRYGELKGIFILKDGTIIQASGRNSGVECLLPKQDVGRSNRLARSNVFVPTGFTCAAAPQSSA